jgi:hypothetical protein
MCEFIFIVKRYKNIGAPIFFSLLRTKNFLHGEIKREGDLDPLFVFVVKKPAT